MTLRTPLLKFKKKPEVLLPELNSAWALARAGKASRADTIARYVDAGLAPDVAAATFDIQWAGFLEFPHHPRVGDLGMEDCLIAFSGNA